METGMNPIPLTLIIGPLGAGKTTLLTQLISHRSAQAQWGVLVNDFGMVGIDAAVLSSSGLVVESLSGGCVCCSLQAMVVQALEKLRAAGVARIWLEPSGIADARALYLALRKVSFVTLTPVIAVLPAPALLAAKYSPVLRAQLALASYIRVSHADATTDEQRARITDVMNGLYPAKTAWTMADLGDVPADWLAGLGLEKNRLPVSIDASLLTAHIDTPHCERNRQANLSSVGLMYPMDYQWSRPCLVKALATCDMTGVQRVKGILRTGPAHWYRVDWTKHGGWQWQESDYAGDNRFEVLYFGQELDWEGVLDGCRHKN
jgi:G3E family GTPase